MCFVHSRCMQYCNVMHINRASVRNSGRAAVSWVVSIIAEPELTHWNSFVHFIDSTVFMWIWRTLRQTSYQRKTFILHLAWTSLVRHRYRWGYAWTKPTRQIRKIYEMHGSCARIVNSLFFIMLCLVVWIRNIYILWSNVRDFCIGVHLCVQKKFTRTKKSFHEADWH